MLAAARAAAPEVALEAAAAACLAASACEPGEAASAARREALALALPLLASRDREPGRRARLLAWRDVLESWLRDGDAPWTDDEERALEAAAVAAPGVFLQAAFELRDEIPVPFTPPDGAAGDARRVDLAARRRRLDRLAGEALAADGRPEYAADVALARWRREGDAVDAVYALHRAGRTREAQALARRALASPTAVRLDVVRLLADRLFAGGAAGRRASPRAAEVDFLAAPGAGRFAALKAATPADQWSAVRDRVLGHLQRTQREPSLVFTLYLDEGLIADADGMAATQRVSSEALTAGAERVVDARPQLAAGWLLVAAMRAADAPQPVRREGAVPLLLRARDLAAEVGRAEDFRRALAILRSRHAGRPAFLRALKRHGL
ncbi:MAG TPA: hypothetical protein VEI02_03590 [Planctomycetota bacterium]|nr:hypothetical protein [Planctomycetota bacterium]